MCTLFNRVPNSSADRAYWERQSYLGWNLFALSTTVKMSTMMELNKSVVVLVREREKSVTINYFDKFQSVLYCRSSGCAEAKQMLLAFYLVHQINLLAIDSFFSSIVTKLGFAAVSEIELCECERGRKSVIVSMRLIHCIFTWLGRTGNSSSSSINICVTLIFHFAPSPR